MSVFRYPREGEAFKIEEVEGVGRFRFRPVDLLEDPDIDLFIDHRTVLIPVDGGKEAVCIHLCGPHPMVLWVAGECFSLGDMKGVVFKLKQKKDLCPLFPDVRPNLFSNSANDNVQGADICLDYFPLIPNVDLHPCTPGKRRR